MKISAKVFYGFIFCVAYANGVTWENLAIDGVPEDTGYDSGVLNDVYLRYHSAMFPESTACYPSWSTCTWNQIHYYLLFVYVHQYPKFKHFKRVMRVRGQDMGISKDAFRDNILPLACRLAAAINEIQWGARLDPRNHHSLFPTTVTGIVDTFPIDVSCPLCSRAHYLFFAKKYESCIVKVQMACTFLKDIIFYSGPHFGAESDQTLGVNHVDTLQFLPFEMWLGDGVYYVCRRLIVPHRTPRNGCLTRRQIIENDLFGAARGVIEQANALIVHHAMFEGRRYRGDLDYLGVFLKITIHMTALYIRMGYGRLPGVGPWSHMI